MGEQQREDDVGRLGGGRRPHLSPLWLQHRDQRELGIESHERQLPTQVHGQHLRPSSSMFPLGNELALAVVLLAVGILQWRGEAGLRMTTRFVGLAAMGLGTVWLAQRLNGVLVSAAPSLLGGA